MSREHRVREGECVASIAAMSGLPMAVVWNDPANADLRAYRATPYQLAPGDVVVVPDRDLRVEGGSTTRRTTFVRSGIPEVVRVRLEDEDGEPLDGVVTFSSNARQGCLAVHSGVAEIPIDPSDRTATITIETDAGQVAYKIQLGSLRPAGGANLNTKVRAAQARLTNLGYECVGVDGKLGPQTRSMIRTFQRDHGLQTAGRLNQTTLEALVRVHGC